MTKPELAELVASVKARFVERDRIRALYDRLSNTTFWAELDSGVDVAVGTEVRYRGTYYVCIRAHTKGLTRLPTNRTYWEPKEQE